MASASIGIMTTSQTNAIHALTYQAMQHQYGVTTTMNDSKRLYDAIIAILDAYKDKAIDDVAYRCMIKDVDDMLKIFECINNNDLKGLAERENNA